jgi:hypothetical protein
MNDSNSGDPVQLLDVSCNHCGAPLSLAADVNFATCAHCGSRLQIHHSGGAAYSQVLASIDQRTQRIERDVAAIKANDDVAALDRQWEMQKQEFMANNRRGGPSIPTTGGSIFAGTITIIFGIIWTIGAAGSNAPAIFPLFGVFFICLGIGHAIYSASKAEAYKEAERQYESRRRDLAGSGRPGH